MTNMWWELMALVEWHYATENSYANMFQSIPRDHESVSRMIWRMVLSGLTTPESPTKSIPIEQILPLSPAPSPKMHVPPESPMSPVKSNLQTTMAHTPSVTILEPPTLDETTSTPVRSKPVTCGTPLRRLSVSPIPYPSATATRGSTRTRKRPVWQSSGDYDMSTE